MNKYFELAKRIALSDRTHKRCLFGAVGLRRDGKIVISKNIRNPGKNVQCHAETRLSRKLDVGSVVYVARIDRIYSNFVNAKPCVGCQMQMRARGVSKVYYTISNTEIGEMNF
jgi:tRNA(Arg) A34 adenosine deaminase TadA